MLTEMLFQAWQLLKDLLRLDTDFLASLAGEPGGNRLAVLIVVLAGVSEALGNSVVLFINRVRFSRFALTLAISGLLHAVTYLFWTASVYTVAGLVFGVDAGFGAVARIVALAQAPRILGFLQFLPLFGRPVGLVLQVLSFLAVLWSVQEALSLDPWQALVSVLLGAVGHVALQNTVGKPLNRLARWMRHRAAGVPLVTDRARLRAIVDAGLVTEDEQQS